MKICLKQIIKAVVNNIENNIVHDFFPANRNLEANLSHLVYRTGHPKLLYFSPCYRTLF